MSVSAERVLTHGTVAQLTAGSGLRVVSIANNSNLGANPDRVKVVFASAAPGSIADGQCEYVEPGGCIFRRVETGEQAFGDTASLNQASGAATWIYEAQG